MFWSAIKLWAWRSKQVKFIGLFLSVSRFKAFDEAYVIIDRVSIPLLIRNAGQVRFRGEALVLL